MLPILDDHAHLSPVGRRAAAVRDFKGAGGTHLIISHMPYGLRPILTKEDWLKDYQITIDLAKEAADATGVKTYCVLGPYPGDIIDFQYNSKLSLDESFEVMKLGVETAAELVKEQKAIGIGEVGRPHFPTDADVMSRSNEILLLCMQKAKDLDCAVVIHSEHANEGNLEEFTQMARSANLRPEKVVKHYCGKLEGSWKRGEISLSVLASRENVESAIRQNLNFMLETDYLDDPSRPGAVLSLATVPKRTNQLHKSGQIDERLWESIHVSRPKRAYGIDTTL